MNFGHHFCKLFPSDEVVTLEVYIQYLKGCMLDLIIFEKTAFGKRSVSSAS